MKNELIVVSEFIRPQLDSTIQYQTKDTKIPNDICIVPVSKYSVLQNMYKLASMEYSEMMSSYDEYISVYHKIEAPNTIYCLVSSKDIADGKFIPMGYFSVKRGIATAIRRTAVVYDVELKSPMNVIFHGEIFKQIVLRFVNSYDEFRFIHHIIFTLPVTNIDGNHLLTNIDSMHTSIQMEKRSADKPDCFVDKEIIKFLNEMVTNELLADYKVSVYNASNLTETVVDKMLGILMSINNTFTQLINAMQVEMRVETITKEQFVTRLTNHIRAFLSERKRGILVTENKFDEVVSIVMFDPSENGVVNVIDALSRPAHAKIMCMSVTHLPEVFRRINQSPSVMVDIEPAQLGMFMKAGYEPVASKSIIAKGHK